MSAGHTPGPWQAVMNMVPFVGPLKTRKPEWHVADATGVVVAIPYASETNARLIAASPKLLAFAATIARLIPDGEEVEGREFVMENDDAVSTLNALIDEARGLVAEAEGLAA